MPTLHASNAKIARRLLKKYNARVPAPTPPTHRCVPALPVASRLQAELIAVVSQRLPQWQRTMGAVMALFGPKATEIEDWKILECTNCIQESAKELNSGRRGGSSAKSLAGNKFEDCGVFVDNVVPCVLNIAVRAWHRRRFEYVRLAADPLEARQNEHALPIRDTGGGHGTGSLAS